MSWNPTKGDLSLHGSLLDRVASDSQKQVPTETQSEVDQLVGSAARAVSDEKMMASLFTAGAAGKFIRLGSLARSASTLESLALRALSHATALAGESAVFAGMERKFAALEGHASTRVFQKDWTNAFINLGSLKLLGGASAGQNLVVQHLLTDLGMVAGHEAAHVLGVAEAPQGDLAQRLIQAEGMNWSMKGSMALLHGFAPGIHALEKSLHLAVGARETGPKTLSPSFFSDLVLAAEGPEELLSRRESGDTDMTRVFSKGESGSRGKSKRDLGDRDENARDSAAIALVQSGVKDTQLSRTLHQGALEFGAEADALKKGSLEARNHYQRAMELEWGAAAAVEVGHEPARSTLYRNAVFFALKAGRLDSAGEILSEGLRGDPTDNFEHELKKSARELGRFNKDRRFILDRLEVAKEYQKVPPDAMLDTPIPVMRSLTDSGKDEGTKTVRMTPLEFCESLHAEAAKAARQAQTLGRRDPLRQQHYGRAMDLEWKAAAEIPPRNEKRRAQLYRNAVEWALKAGRPAEAKKIIFNAVLNDFGAMAEDAIRRSAEKLWPWDVNKKFILTALEEGKAFRKFMEVLQPALASGGASAPEPLPTIMMPVSTPKTNGGSPEEGGPRPPAASQEEPAMDAPTLRARELLKVGEGSVAPSVAMETKAVCINVGRYYFVEKVRPDTTIKNADLFIEHQGTGRGYLFITNKSGQDLFLVDAEGEPRKVEKDIAYPLRPGERFVFNGKLYTWGKPKESPWLSQDPSRPALETVKAVNARILADEEAAAILQAGVYYGLKREQLSLGAEERTVRIPIFLDISSGLIAAVGEAPEELRSKTVPVELIVLVPKSDRTQKDQAPTIVGMTVSGSGTRPDLAETVQNLNGKTFLYPHFGMPAMEYGTVVLDARRSRTL